MNILYIIYLLLSPVALRGSSGGSLRAIIIEAKKFY
jgi:hypothetical protein